MPRLFIFSVTTVLFATAPAAYTPTNHAPVYCVADSNFSRLNFWIGEWGVFDSTGKQYASQKVRPILDGCALAAEWVGPDGDKGLGLFAYDGPSHRWTQTYAFNQVPYPGGVYNRVSDTTYAGPGVRLIPRESSAGAKRSRLTISPLGNDRVGQQFEESTDGGSTWRTLFKAEDRRAKSASSEK